jgi:TRAP-type C4-dicarboxylate transport system permease small subunit
LATQQEKHINLDIVTRFISPRLTNIIRAVTSLFAVIVTAFLSKAGWVFLQNEISSGDILITVGKIDCPAWWFQLIIPIGFGLMAFRFLLRTVGHFLATFHPSPSAPPPINVPTIEV